MTNVTTAPIDVARKDLASQQSAYGKRHAKGALAGEIADGFVVIENILATTSVEDQALILSAHQVNPATGSTSVYSPWIAAMWGETDPGAKKVLDLDEIEHPKWVPNASRAVYFHAMERFKEEGFDRHSNRTKLIARILEVNGAQKFANERKARIAAGGKDARVASEQERRDLYLADGPRSLLDLGGAGIDLPTGDAQVFFTMLVERDQQGAFVFRGIADKDAKSALNKLAKAEFDHLTAERARRNEEAERKKLFDFEIEKARREAREEALAEVKAARS